MSWSKEVDELKRQRDFALQMGGAEGVAKQRERGKLTVRERIDAIADPGSFREFLGLTGTATYENCDLRERRPTRTATSSTSCHAPRSTVSRRLTAARSS